MADPQTLSVGVRVSIEPDRTRNVARLRLAFRDASLSLSPPFRTYVEAAFRDAPEYFWCVPASMSGKDHPRACRRQAERFSVQAFWQGWQRLLMSPTPTIRQEGSA
ncbi:MAG: hypothetical protein ACOC0M_06760 [Halomonas sp.]